MNRLRNPALVIGFLGAVNGLVLASSAVPAGWHPGLNLAGGILALVGSWFFGAGLAKPDDAKPDAQS